MTSSSSAAKDGNELVFVALGGAGEIGGGGRWWHGVGTPMDWCCGFRNFLPLMTDEIDIFELKKK